MSQSDFRVDLKDLWFFTQTLPKLLQTEQLTDIEFGSKEGSPETISFFDKYPFK